MSERQIRYAAPRDPKRVANDPSRLAALLRSRGCRLVVWGPPGAGKSTLVSNLAAGLADEGLACRCIAVDPGSPGFGVPGALALASWREGAWAVESLTALCTLNAVRFRLPLTQALERLAQLAPERPLLVDAPGVVRGLAAAELLAALVVAVRADAVLAILPQSGVEAEVARTALSTLDTEVLLTEPAPLARRRSKRERARVRTAQWDAWLAGAEEQMLDPARMRMSGIWLRQPEAWSGRQVALLDRKGETAALGEAVGPAADGIRVRLRWLRECAGGRLSYLVRDAGRRPDGLLGTRKPVGGGPRPAALPPDLVPPAGPTPDPACFVHLGIASALLVNGVFGDPLLHMRLRQQRRSLLFDLGDGARLPAKLAHQVSDVFISHAHLDHIGGFLWLLRSRIGEDTLCRLYGPPGLADHIAAFITAIRWDRIGERGPRFEIRELHGDRLRLFRIRVGFRSETGGELPIAEGTLLQEAGFRVRAVTLDHGIPVLAFAFEATPTVRILKDRLRESELPDGPWLGELKQRLVDGQGDAEIRLPDGRVAAVSRLAEQLVVRQPMRRLVYATDLADTPSNRERLIALARGADTLVCEAAFSQEDAGQARRTGHLTARASGEIAAAAGVGRLIPFHFSRRYEKDPERIYAEVEAAFGPLSLGARGE